MKFTFLCVFFLICWQSSVAEIFKWVDSDGVTHYSESKPEKNHFTSLQIPSYQIASIVEEDLLLFEKGAKKKSTYKPLVRNGRVVIYTTQSCGYCKKAKAFFKKKEVAYKEYDIEKNKMARVRYDKLGATGVPVIFVGKKRMNGFSESRFKQIYQF